MWIDDAESWEKVVRKLRAGMMPPPGKKRPSRADAEAIASAAGDAPRRRSREKSARRACAGFAPPESHRIRQRHPRPVRHADGRDGPAASDDASNGFDNVASGLGISPALIQGYTSAAMKLSRAAVGDMTASQATAIYEAPEKLAQDQHLEGLPLGSRGGMRIEHEFPLDAEYHFSVRGQLQAAAERWRRDGCRPRRPACAGRRTFAISACRSSAGRHVLTATLFETLRSTGVNDIYSVYKSDAGLDRVEITGPFNATAVGDTGEPSAHLHLSAAIEGGGTRPVPRRFW